MLTPSITIIHSLIIYVHNNNYALYRGKQVIQPQQLDEIDPTTLWIEPASEKANPFYLKKMRDIFKRCAIFKDDQQTYLMLGIENQLEQDFFMPFRVLVYDALAYHQQIKAAQYEQKSQKKADHSEFLSGISKETRLAPVITMVCNFGSTAWKGPRQLHDMLNAPQEILQFVPNYHFILFDPHQMSKRKLKSLKSQLNLVARCLHASRYREELKKVICSDRRFKILDCATAQLINHLLKFKLQITSNQSAEKINLCKAWEEILEEAENKGIEKGIDIGIEKGIDIGIGKGETKERNFIAQKMIAKNRYSDDEIMDLAGITMQNLQDIKSRTRLVGD